MEPLQVHLILEILGRPAENVKDALSLLVSKMETEPGVKVLERNFHDPVAVKDANDLFTAFVEVTLQVDTLEHYLLLLFTYMPSHTELVYPEKIALENTQFNQVTHLLIQRLHQYDAVTKKLVVEREMILQKIQKEAPHLLKANPIVTPLDPASAVPHSKQPSKVSQKEKNAKPKSTNKKSKSKKN